jgi:hypothetical protein
MRTLDAFLSKEAGNGKNNKQVITEMKLARFFKRPDKRANFPPLARLVP